MNWNYSDGTLRDLDDININPVTIPREWNIQRIPNLLNAYDRRIEDELYKKQQEEIGLQILKDYYDECKKRARKSKKILTVQQKFLRSLMRVACNYQ